MRFCSNCENMYYIQFNEEKKLSYYCRNCGHTTTDNVNIVVSKTTYNKDKHNYSSMINKKYIKMDPTIPRTNLVKCINTKCKSSEEGDDQNGLNKEKNILYFRYNQNDLGYLFMCPECDYIWKNNSS